MRKWLIACSVALLTAGFAATAHADEWNKLTYLTFSGPVNMPGITLPAGTYRFELMDPDSSRRVIRVSDKDGSKHYGIFLSIADQKLEPSDKPVVMFKEMPAGAPQAVQAWFYPGETTGYEFVYPHDQAVKIAKATHRSVLAMKDTAQTTTEEERAASMKSAEYSRVNENDKPVSTDEQLKESSALHPSNSAAANSAAATTTAPAATTTAPAATTTARANTAAAAPQPTTSEPNGNPESNAQSTTARANTAAPANAAQPTTAPRSTTGNRAVGTSGTASQTPTATDNTSASPRRRLPKTGSELPLMQLLSGLAFAGAAAARRLRR